MKKALIIANMLFASANVFGIFNNPDAPCESFSSRKRSISQIDSEESSSNKRIAAKSKTQEVIVFLIKNGLDISYTRNGQNFFYQNDEDINYPISLYEAVSNKNLKLANLLISSGTKFNDNDKENRLFKAIDTNNMENVRYLISKGVKIGYKNGVESFLDRAVTKKYFDISKYLIENGAEAGYLKKYQVLSFVIKNGSLDLVKHFVSKGVDVNLVDGYKRTLLHNAVITNKFDIVEYLVNAEGININAQDNSLYTPLLYAVEKKQTNIAELLIKKLAEKDSTGNALNIMGRSKNQNISIDKTPLYEASQNGSLDIVKLLAENGADLNKKASNGISPIDIAFQNDHLDIMKYLIEQGADINLIDNNGMSLISKIIVKNSKDSVDLVDYLIEKGSKINRQSNDGWTPLHEAVQAGNKKMVQLLLDHDAFVNAADTKGWTPLHEASQRGNIEIFKLLVENGADSNASFNYNVGFDSQGRRIIKYITPIDVAQNYGYSNISEYLIKFTSDRLTSDLKGYE